MTDLLDPCSIAIMNCDPGFHGIAQTPGRKIRYVINVKHVSAKFNVVVVMGVQWEYSSCS